MSHVLHVLLDQKHAGDVTQSPTGNLTFAYDPDYLSNPAATPLSLSMPRGRGTFRQRTVRAYLNGLLPDREDVRERWGRQFGVNPANPAALLSHMGLDCAGGVQFTPNDPNLTFARESTITPVSDAHIATRLRALRRDTSGWTVPGERWSLAGAQAKFALARTVDGAWFEPSGAEPSTHIFKPGIPGYRDQALNEHLCLQACSALGIAAARTEIMEFDGEVALVATRYDRTRTENQVVRLHQEDMCQALSVPPHRKYETSGGPTAQQISTLLRDAGVPERDLSRFADAVIVNYLLGAPDAHAKNYSVLLRARQVRLAPLYDVASALPYDAQDSGHELDRAAMSIGGEKIFGRVTGRHWARFARAIGMNEDQVLTRVRDIANALPDALNDVAQGYRGPLSQRLTTSVAQLTATSLAHL